MTEPEDVARLEANVRILRRRSWERATETIWWDRYGSAVKVLAGVLVGVAVWALQH